MEDVLCNLEYDRTLGEGSYGKVYLVRNTHTSEKFAVKEVDLSKYHEEERENALREAKLLAKLDHGGILKYIESVISEDYLYIVTEYCEGGDVDIYLQKCKMKDIFIPESVICLWITQVSDALQYLHKNRILHRDLKTKNIFLLKTFCVKLGDFGIAKALDPSRSMAESFIGTPAYMSPEIFSYQPYNYKTDIWSLGCCAVEMMTLKKAFQGGFHQVIQGVKKGQMPVLPEMYSTDLRKLIMQFLHRVPDERPSASDLVKNTTLIKCKRKARDDISKLPVPDAEEASVQQTRKGSQGHVARKSSFQNVMMVARERQEEVKRQSIKNALDKFNSLHLMDGTSKTDVKKVEQIDDEEEEEDFVDTFIVHDNNGQRRDSTLKNPLQKSVHTSIENVEARHIKKAWMVDLDGNENTLNTKQPRKPKKLSKDLDGKQKGLDVEQFRTRKMNATFAMPVSGFGTTYTVSKFGKEFADIDLQCSSDHIIPAEENPAATGSDIDEQMTILYDRQLKKSDNATDSDSDFQTEEKPKDIISKRERIASKPLRSKSGSGDRFVISPEVEEEGVEEPQFGAHEIIQHVRGNLSAFHLPSQEQESSEITKKKKKAYLKNHAVRKKRDNTVEESGEIKKAVADKMSVKKERAITLFTRAQNVRYVKEGESLGMESSFIKEGPGFTPFDKKKTTQDLKDLVVLVSSEDNKTLTMDQLVQVQQ
ncbi:hypothetical protein CHS0354_002465 [Potamilus streckersoni]|nr:hypothetical protein CHS0354_002465 [Potamilus streckersoni]